MNCSACGDTHTGASGWCPKRKIHTLMCFSVDGPMPLEMAGWAFQTGAAVAFGLVGMAWAIRRRHRDDHARECNRTWGRGECDCCGGPWVADDRSVDPRSDR